MTTMSNAVELRDVFYEFSLTQDVPDAVLLDRFSQRYPQYAKELTEFAIELILDVMRDSAGEASENAVPNPNTVTPVVSRAISRFQNRLYSVARSLDMTSLPENPFESLSRSEYRSFAARIDVTSVFVSKLRDRQISPETIPYGFLHLVANELPASLDVLVLHFNAPQALVPARQFYKADDKPNASGRQTFIEAVQNSELSEPQQQRLLSL